MTMWGSERDNRVTRMGVTFGVTPTVRVLKGFASLRGRRQQRRRRLSRRHLRQ